MTRFRLRDWMFPRLRNGRDEVSKMGEAFLDFWQHVSINPQPPSGRPAGVLVTPWVNTPVPWYSIALAAGLARRGRDVYLVWDDTVSDDSPMMGKRSGSQTQVLHRTLRAVEADLPVLCLRPTAIFLNRSTAKNWRQFWSVGGPTPCQDRTLSARPRR